MHMWSTLSLEEKKKPIFDYLPVKLLTFLKGLTLPLFSSFIFPRNFQLKFNNQSTIIQLDFFETRQYFYKLLDSEFMNFPRTHSNGL